MQYLVVAHDGTDPEALERRLRVRADHLAKVDEMVAKGQVLYAAAIMDDTERMVGSMLVVDFPTRAAVDTWLGEEPYVVGDVWRDITVTRCRTAPQFASPAG